MTIMTTRYKPAKRAGGWGSLFFTLLGGKEGQVSKIVIVTILIIVIIIMIIVITIMIIVIIIMIIVITILIIVIIITIIDGKVKWKVPNNADYDYHFQSRIGKSMPGNKVEKTLHLTRMPGNKVETEIKKHFTSPGYRRRRKPYDQL